MTCMANEAVVEVAWMPTDQSVRQVSLKVPHGSSIATVLQVLSLTDTAWHLSVHGHRATLQDIVEAGDRIECCRVLRIDPKAARRSRSQKR